MPEPKPGLVIRYSFLWSHERDKGLAEGSKDRPCAIVLAMRRMENGEIQVVVAPITHSPAADETASVEISASVARTLGLDEQPHWLRCEELNRFIWPGYDLRTRPDMPHSYEYGMLPKALFETLRTKIVRRQRTGAGRIIPR